MLKAEENKEYMKILHSRSDAIYRITYKLTVTGGGYSK